MYAGDMHATDKFLFTFFFSTCDAYLLVQSLNTPEGHKDDSNTYKEEALNLNLVQ